MGNVKSNPVVPGPNLDRKRTTKRTTAKTKQEDGVSAWQPPGPKSYIDMEIPEEKGAILVLPTPPQAQRLEWVCLLGLCGLVWCGQLAS